MGRENESYNRKAKYPKLEDKLWLYRQYIVLERTSTSISEELQCNPLTVVNWLRKNDIKVRKSRRPPTVFPNEVYGKLTVIVEDSSIHHIGRKFKCECKCGRQVVVAAGALRNGNTTSCGNCRAIHGHSWPKRSPTYMSWTAMLQRCYNVKYNGYKDYGGRGIKTCDRWKKFENFLEDMGVRPEGMSLDRKNVNGNYELNNCRWATKQQQARNKRCDRCLILEDKIVELENLLNRRVVA